MSTVAIEEGGGGGGGVYDRFATASSTTNWKERAFMVWLVS